MITRIDEIDNIAGLMGMEARFVYTTTKPAKPCRTRTPTT
jgi:hypothetical protein